MRKSNPTKTLQAEQRNGVYLLKIHSEFGGYRIKSLTDQIWTDQVTINGNYIEVSDSFETECDGFDIKGDVVDLRYDNVSSDGGG